MAKTKCRCIRDMEPPNPTVFNEGSCMKNCPGNTDQKCGHNSYSYWSIYEAITPGMYTTV